MTEQVRYATREAVMSALDVAETARSVSQIDRLLTAASRSVEALCRRRFYPEWGTRYIEWPTAANPGSFRLWLDADHELISLTTLTTSGGTITDYYLEPQGAGPPYTRLELNRATATGFGAGQRSIALTGVFGACADVEPVGATTEALDTTETGVDGSGMAVGVGDLLKIDDEYMQVVGRAQLGTGATLAAELKSAPAATVLTLAGTAAFVPGEAITIDGERMLITDAYDTTLVVERKWSGSVLAAHAVGAAVRAPRTLTVRRGVLGTSPASHSSGATVYRHVPPPLVTDLTIAETLVALAREQSGYARTIGAGEGERNATSTDIRDLRDRVWAAHARKVRIAAV